MAGPLILMTGRLRLEALGRDALQAWVDGDGASLARETGAVFDDPLEPPPLLHEDLPRFRDRMTETPAELGWWVWLIVRREDVRAVGVCGLGGRPDAHGAVVLGYSVYPSLEGRGYATEAAEAVMDWALGQPGVRTVRILAPVWNQASIAVARKLGTRAAGFEASPEVGEVAIFERDRDP